MTSRTHNDNRGASFSSGSGSDGAMAVSQDEKKVAGGRGSQLSEFESYTTPYNVSNTEQGGKSGPIIDDQGNEETLHRALNDSQISMIAIAGAIGTGLIISSGTALAQGGPGGLLIGYAIMGAVCWVVLNALGEITSYMPLAGFTGLAGRYIDPAAGVALGGAYLCQFLVITPNQINASAVLISFWRSGLHGSIFISVFIAFIIASNFCGVRFFGHFEYWMSFAKIVILTGIILGGFIISLGGNPLNDRIGFRYWKNGGAFREHNQVTGAKGRFFGVVASMSSALFAYLHSELVGVCAGETSNPRKAIPRAIKMVIYRILVFYIGGVIVIGMLVSADNSKLLQSGKAAKTAAASPFVLAVQSVGIEALPSILNASLLVFTLSASNSDLYVATRTMYGLARDGQLPFHRTLLRTNSMGVPYVCLSIASCFCALAYLNASSGGSATFAYLTSTVTIFGGIAWFGILLTHIRFMAGCRAQGIERSMLPYAAPLQPYASWIALFITTVVLIFQGFASFFPVFDYRTFITHYIGIPITAFIYIGYKVWHKTKIIKASEMNLADGARRYDSLDMVGEDKRRSVKQAWAEETKWYKKPLALRHVSI